MKKKLNNGRKQNHTFENNPKTFDRKLGKQKQNVSSPFPRKIDLKISGKGFIKTKKNTGRCIGSKTWRDKKKAIGLPIGNFPSYTWLRKKKLAKMPNFKSFGPDGIPNFWQKQQLLRSNIQWAYPKGKGNEWVSQKVTPSSSQNLKKPNYLTSMDQ